MTTHRRPLVECLTICAGMAAVSLLLAAIGAWAMVGWVAPGWDMLPIVASHPAVPAVAVAYLGAMAAVFTYLRRH